jgi:hypothetical protein
VEIGDYYPFTASSAAKIFVLARLVCLVQVRLFPASAFKPFASTSSDYVKQEISTHAHAVYSIHSHIQYGFDDPQIAETAKPK